MSTIDSFQNKEAECVIITMARTSKSDFIRDNPRVTIAVTRALKALYIVGRPNVMAPNVLQRSQSRKDSIRLIDSIVLRAKQAGEYTFECADLTYDEESGYQPGRPFQGSPYSDSGGATVSDPGHPSSLAGSDRAEGSDSSTRAGDPSQSVDSTTLNPLTESSATRGEDTAVDLGNILHAVRAAVSENLPLITHGKNLNVSFSLTHGHNAIELVDGAISTDVVADTSEAEREPVHHDMVAKGISDEVGDQSDIEQFYDGW